MKLIGIDIGKNRHFFCVSEKGTGEIISKPTSFTNDKKGFDYLLERIKAYPKDSVLIGMEDTGHYHFALLQYLLKHHYRIALINPRTTDLNRKMQGGITKNDKLDTVNICDILETPERMKQYRITTIDSYDLYEQKQLTRQHHNMKEQLNVYKNRLQKSIDIVFPEFNRLFKSKYGIVYMNILETFGSAEIIASTDIRTIRKCFDINKRGVRISLTAEQLKEVAKSSVGISSMAEVMQIRHLTAQIRLIEEQLSEIDKKIEEFSAERNSPILTIPGISHFSGTSILAELGDIGNYSRPSQIIKFAGVALKPVQCTAHSHNQEGLKIPEEDALSGHSSRNQQQSYVQGILSAEDCPGKGTSLCIRTLCEETAQDHLPSAEDKPGVQPSDAEVRIK